jgi:hypothetical protein
MKFCHLQVNGWNWTTSSEERLSKFRRPKAAYFLSYLEYNRANKNTAILLKIGHTKGRSHMTRGR